MVQPPPALHRAILVVDVEGFNDQARTNLDQVRVRAALYQALRQAFDESGTPWDRSHFEDRGDGAFFLIHPDVPKALLSGALTSALAKALAEHNRTSGPGTKIRLRMVLHAGEVHHDEHGVAGAALNYAFRLLDAQPVKSALAASPGNLALVASEWFFEEVIRHDPGSEPGRYRRIAVSVKETSTTALLSLPDHPGWQGEGLEQAVSPDVAPGARYAPHRNRGFVGREDLVWRISEALLTRGGSRAVVLHGMAGVGKSQLAREAAYRLADRFAGVWWADAGHPLTLARDLGELADRFGVPQDDAAGRVRLLWPELAKSGRWLLVYDNAVGEEELVPWWPADTVGGLLVTSRSPHWQESETLLVKPFSRAESRILLCGRGEAAQPDADAVAAELGDLPLALSQAAAYVARNRTDWKSYRALLRAAPARLLGLHQPGDYPGTAAATLTLSLERVAEQQPESADLLRLISFLDPERIPRDLLYVAPTAVDADDLPDGVRVLVEDRVTYDQAVGALAGYALVEAAPETIQVHRLVQTIVKDSIPAAQLPGWVGAAGRLLAARFPERSRIPENWQECALLLPHVAAVAGPSRTHSAAPVPISALCRRAADYLIVRGQHREALELLGPALALCQEAFGRGSEEYAQTLTSQGEAECYLGRHLQAVDTGRAALAVLEGLAGPESSSVVPTLRLLGRALTEAGEPVEAVDVLERASRICLSEFGDRDARTAEVLARLAYARWRGGDPDEARSTYNRAAKVWRAAGTAPDREQTVARRWLACVLADLGEWADARAEVEDAIRLARELYGPEHVETVRAEGTLGMVLAGTGQLFEAERLQERMVAFLRESYRVPVVIAGALTELAKTRLLADRPRDALADAEEALALYTEEHGTLNHVYNAGALTVLGLAQRSLGKLADAAESLNRAKEIYERAGGPAHLRNEVETHLRIL